MAGEMDFILFFCPIFAAVGVDEAVSMKRARNLSNMQANKSENEAKPHYKLKILHL